MISALEVLKLCKKFRLSFSKLNRIFVKHLLQPTGHTYINWKVCIDRCLPDKQPQALGAQVLTQKSFCASGISEYL